MKLGDFAVDPGRIEGGDWVDMIPDCGDLRIRTRGLGNADWRRLQQQKLAALPRRDRRNGIVPEAIEAINLDCLVETCLLDWANLTGADGAPLPFSKETARKYLADPRYRPLLDACYFAAREVAERRAEEQEDDAKN